MFLHVYITCFVVHIENMCSCVLHRDMYQICSVRMDKYVWLEEMLQQGEWNFAITMSGAQCVIIYGMLLML